MGFLEEQANKLDSSSHESFTWWMIGFDGKLYLIKEPSTTVLSSAIVDYTDYIFRDADLVVLLKHNSSKMITGFSLEDLTMTIMRKKLPQPATDMMDALRKLAGLSPKKIEPWPDF